MSKRVITTYAKLNPILKKAIKEKYPDGVEDNLTVMKNVFKGYFFDGLVFDYDDTTYMIEWSAGSYIKKVEVEEEDFEEISDVEDGLEDMDNEDSEADDDEDYD